jgi:uncharacterized cupredoxin-like copper-binding protein
VIRKAVGVLLLAVTLAACGGGAASGPKKTMTVIGTEMKFEAPDHVPAGTYQVTFQNAGTTYHELAFKNPGGEIVTRRSIAAGQFITMDVELGAGTWELACYEPGHYDAGMHKPLTVDKT